MVYGASVVGTPIHRKIFLRNDQRNYEDQEEPIAFAPRLDEANCQGRAVMHPEKRNDLTDVIQQCRDKLKADPLDVGALFLMGNALRSIGEKEQAKAVYETLLRLEPNDHEVMHAYGRTLLEMHQRADAVSWLKKAIHVWEKEPVYFADLGDALASLGQVSEAKHAYKSGLSICLPGEDVADRIRQSMDLLDQGA
jgi:tetratricopeptide (TPR) repeat protein